jgi:hypothetical protein
MAKFTGGGGKDKMLLQPSRVQNKRHHINSLAMRAAETEIALLDAKGNRGKTKAETQVNTRNHRYLSIYVFINVKFDYNRLNMDGRLSFRRTYPTSLVFLS